MARVFLSYAREDQKRAKAVATSLEKAGHSVWWDRQLVGGSDYSAAIDSALGEAGAVVVLWSKASVASPWVRDEAAKGRDSGRLVPATLDQSEPPLGFGQYHTIDLSRPRSAAGLRELEAALSGKDEKRPQAASAGAAGHRAFLLRPLAVLAALAFIAAAFLGWRLYSTGSGPAQQLVLAVMPFDDMSPGRDQAALGEGVAEEIMTLVSGTPGLRVIGRTSAWQLKNESGNLQQLRSRLKATHLLEGSVRSSGEDLRLSARLIETGTGEEIWSEEFRRPMSDIFSVQETIGAAIAERLRGTVTAQKEAAKARSIRTDPEAYKLYLAARAVGHQRTYESQVKAEQLLKQALAIDPDYAPAHAFMAITLEVMDNRHPSGTDQNSPESTAKALGHARRAIELAPRFAEGHIALGMALDDDPEAALRALSRGKELDPGNFYAWNISGTILRNLCRPAEAIEQFRRAIQIEPLLFVPYSNLANTFGDLGQDNQANSTIDSYLAAGGGKSAAALMRGEQSYWSGDLGDAFRQLDDAAAGGSSPQLQLYAAHIRHHFGDIAGAIAALPESYRELLGAYWRGDYDRASEAALRFGPQLFNMPYLPVAGAKGLVHAGRGSELLRLVAGRWGSLDEFLKKQACDLHKVGPTLVVALRQTGRDGEAQRLLKASESEHRLRSRNGYGPLLIEPEKAALLALRGRSDEAIAALNKAVDAGWVDQGGPYITALADPAFNSLRPDPRFKAIERRIAEKIAAQRAQLHTDS